MKPIIP